MSFVQVGLIIRQWKPAGIVSQLRWISILINMTVWLVDLRLQEVLSMAWLVSGHDRKPEGKPSFIIIDLLSPTMYFLWWGVLIISSSGWSLSPVCGGVMKGAADVLGWQAASPAWWWSQHALLTPWVSWNSVWWALVRYLASVVLRPLCHFWRL